MADREQERERRRREREAAQLDADRANRKRRNGQLGFGAAVIAAVIAVVVVIALAGNSDDAPDPDDVAAAATAAGCTFREFPEEGSEHTTEEVEYATNPPTSGPHAPEPAKDGIYAPGNEPADEQWVHTLEHGRVIFQYAPGSSDEDVAKLRQLAEEPLNGTEAYHTVLLQNNTEMPAKFAAVSWTRYVTCDELTDEAVEVLRSFRATFTDKAPELIP